MVACGYAALLPLTYGAAPLAYGAAPLAYAGAHPVAYSAAAFPTYETVSHSVAVGGEPVEQHGYIVKY